MATYELTIITPGDEDTAAAGAIIADTQKILKVAEATIKQEHQWGRRPLAYTIGKQNHGYYTTFEYEAAPSAVVGIERAIRLHGKVIRFLTTEAFDEPSSLAPAVNPVVDEETRSAEELLRRSSTDAPKRAPKKKPVKAETAEDASERQQQVEEALSKILEDEPEQK